MKICSQPGCNNKHLAKGMCRNHYDLMYKYGRLHKILMRGESVKARIIAKITEIDKGFPSLCWEFNGVHNGNKYGMIRDEDGNMRSAHIIMYRLTHGPVPQGLELDHLCRFRSCCNPAHLEAVTHEENMKRAIQHNDWGFARLSTQERKEQARKAAQTRWPNQRG